MTDKKEFERIRQSFGKVKEDMQNITHLISTNTEDFFQKHKGLANEVYKLTQGLRDELNNIKVNHQTNKNTNDGPIKEEIKFLKENMQDVLKNNADVYNLLDRIKSNEIGVKDLKKKLGTDELEIHLLKERLIEKDFEVKKMKEINIHMLDVMDDLSNIEEHIISTKITKAKIKKVKAKIVA